MAGEKTGALARPDSATLGACLVGRGRYQVTRRVLLASSPCSLTRFPADRSKRDRANPAEAVGDAGGHGGRRSVLASPLASYVVGQTIVVDGGLIL